jgi:hypothetical protein
MLSLFLLVVGFASGDPVGIYFSGPGLPVSPNGFGLRRGLVQPHALGFLNLRDL